MPTRYFDRQEWRNTDMCLILQVRMALQDMSEVESMCLPGLETIGFFSAVYFQGERAPAFEAGSALAYEQGVHGVCNAVGNLVEQKILPSLQQVQCSSPPLRSG